MGKRILQRRRGKGGLQYRAPIRGKRAPSSYPFYNSSETHRGIVTRIVDERGRSAPLAQILFDDGRHAYIPAVSGLTTGSNIHLGPDAPPAPGNILPLNKIPEGTTVCNIERVYGDGGEFVRASGTSAILFSQSPAGAVIKFPSGKSSLLAGKCRASIGAVAGGGRTERPFLKAGTRYYDTRARGKLYPRMRGIAMSAVYHPFGGGRHQHPGKSTSTSRNAPPGRKVGLIAPRKTGRKRIARQP